MALAGVRTVLPTVFRTQQAVSGCELSTKPVGNSRQLTAALLNSTASVTVEGFFQESSMAGAAQVLAVSTYSNLLGLEHLQPSASAIWWNGVAAVVHRIGAKRFSLGAV